MSDKSSVALELPAAVKVPAPLSFLLCRSLTELLHPSSSSSSPLCGSLKVLAEKQRELPRGPPPLLGPGGRTAQPLRRRSRGRPAAAVTTLVRRRLLLLLRGVGVEDAQHQQGQERHHQHRQQDGDGDLARVVQAVLLGPGATCASSKRVLSSVVSSD